MKYYIDIPKRLTGLNEYTNANRNNKYAGAKLKKEEQEYIKLCIRQQLGNAKIQKPVIGHFIWIEENKRRDLDNICFAKKFILDSLVELGVLKDDNRKMVCGFTDEFRYSKPSKVCVILEEIEKEAKNNDTDNR